MRRKLLTVILATALVLTMIPTVAFAGLTEAKTPAGLGNTSLKWSYDFQSGSMDFSRAPTVPALIGGAIYVGSADKVYKFHKDTGKILARSKALPGTMGYGTTPLIGDESGVYVFVTGSRVVKLSLDLKKVLWTGPKYGGQNITPIKLIEGRIYGGTWGDDEEGGTYFCLDASTGKEIWTQYDTEGFYWAGAAETEGTVFFASDSFLKDTRTRRGSANIYAVSADAASGTKPTLVRSESMTRIRSTPAVDNKGYLYYTSVKEGQKGALTKYRYRDGRLSRVMMLAMGTSSNTPVIDGDVIFVGDGNYMEGGDGRCIYAVDRNTMKVKAKVKAPAPVQGELLVSKRGGKYRIYATYNNIPGGLFYAEMPLDASEVSKSGELFRPVRSQYCISNVVCDASTGTLYYKNDSGSVMAVKEGHSDTAVKGVKAKASGASGIQVDWKGRENVKSYEVLLSKDGKKYSKAGSVSESDSDISVTVEKLTAGKTYRVKVRARLLAGEAKDSSVVKVTLPPAAPKVKGKNVKSKSVRLTWKKVTGAAGYEVFRAGAKNGPYKKIKTLKGKTFTDKKLNKGRTYYYKVRAFSKNGSKKVCGPWSNVISVKIKK